MPLTAPPVTDSATRLQISMRFVDRSGDLRSVAVTTFNTSVTRAQIQAMVAAYAAASQANLYSVSIEEVYDDGVDAGDALVGPANSVFDNVVLLFKSPIALKGENTFVPAPIPAIVPPDTDTIVLSALEDVTDTTEVVLGPTWDDRSVRYTERREKNERRVT